MRSPRTLQPIFDPGEPHPAPGIQARLHPVARVGDGPRRLLLVAIGLLVLATLKPWAAGQGRIGQPAGRGPGPAAPSAKAVSSSASAAMGGSERHADPGRGGKMACSGPSDWQLVTLVQAGSHEIRGRYAVAGVQSLVGMPAPGGIDLRVVAGNFVGLGLCAPSGDPAAGPAPLLGVWTASSTGRPAAAITRLPSIGSPAGETATLYGYPAQEAARGAAGRWPPGRYLLEALDPRGNPDRVEWVGVEIVAPAPGAP